MILFDWEVWHTYSLSFCGRLPPLKTVARRIVDSNLATAAICSDGTCFVRSGYGVDEERVELGVSPDLTRARFSIPETATAFAREAIIQAQMMRHSEIRVFGNSEFLANEYVRFPMGEVRLFESTQSNPFGIFPVVKLYSTGAILVSFRIFSPDHPTSVEDFVSRILRTPAFKRFEIVYVPAAVARLAPRVYIDSLPSSVSSRLRAIRADRQHSLAVDKLSILVNSGAQRFQLAPLASLDPEGERFSSLAQTIAGTVAFVASGRRQTLPFLLRRNTKGPRICGRWVGRQHVHLLRFENQQETTGENEHVHGASLARIVARIDTQWSQALEDYLPRDSRRHGDQGAYIHSTGSLWVHSTRSLALGLNDAGDIANLAPIVYEQQVLAEAMDHGYILNRNLAERLDYIEDRPEDVVRAHGLLIRLNAELSEAGRFGDVRRLLEDSWSALGVPALRIRIQEALGLRQIVASIGERRRLHRWTTAVMVILGAGVVPTLARDILAPIWRLAGLPQPFRGNEDAEAMMLVGVAGALVGLALFGFHRRTRAS